MDNYKIEIEGAFGEKNFGDDALLKVLHKELCREISPKKILIRTKTGASLRNFSWLCPESRITIPGDLKSVFIENKVFGGGTQFFDFKKKTFSEILKIYNFQIPKILFRKIKERINSGGYKVKNTHFLGIGVGPFTEDHISKKVTNHLKSATTLSVRDTESKRLLDLNGITHVEGSDICFSAKIQNSGNRVSNPKTIFVILRDWPHDKSHAFSEMQSQIERLSTNSNIKIQFGLIGDDPQWADYFKKRALSIFQYAGTEASFIELLNLMQKSDVVVSSRYHGIVYSLLLGIPAFSVNIEPKLSTAAKDLELAGSLNIEELLELPNRLEQLSMEDEYKKVDSIVARERQKSTMMMEQFLENMRQC